MKPKPNLSLKPKPSLETDGYEVADFGAHEWVTGDEYEDFGVENRGSFYETAGCLRDIIQNHLFQIVALLAMEPPAYQGFGAVHSEKAKVFQAMRPLKRDDLVRGQYAGYRKDADVAESSDVETFCALRLFLPGGATWQ